MPFSWEGKVEEMEYKTLRYPGHVAIMRPIRQLGLLSNEPITVKGQQVVPRDLFIAAATPTLRKPDGHDLVALRVVVSGEKGGSRASTTFDLLDWYDRRTDQRHDADDQLLLSLTAQLGRRDGPRRACSRRTKRCHSASTWMAWLRIG
jgi:saccharopine dehydrogenase-like NADP-dependent oxidoreductase